MRFSLLRLLSLLSLLCLQALTLTSCSQKAKRAAGATYVAPEVRYDHVDPRKPAESEKSLENQYASQPSAETRVLTRYLEAQVWAQTDPAKSCSLWLETLRDPLFPLRSVAKLHAIETCIGSAATGLVPDVPLEPWLGELTQRALLKQAVQKHDVNTEMRLSASVAGFEKIQRDRVRLISRAVEIASQLKDESSVALYQQMLERVAPRFAVNPKPEQYMNVANDFKNAREFTKARFYYQKVIESDAANSVDRLHAFDGIRMTFKLQKSTPEFLSATEKMAAFARERFFAPGAPETSRSNVGRYFDAKLTLARAVWTEHQPTQANLILQNLETEIKARYPIDESLLIRARIAEEAGDLKTALALLSQINTDRISDRDLRIKILWIRAWDLRKVGKSKEAISQFEQLARTEQSFSTLMRAHYWLARSQAENNIADRATAEYEWLTENDPMGYYGLLAYRALKRPMPAPLRMASAVPAGSLLKGNGSTSKSSSTSSIAESGRVFFDWLVACNEGELARAYLDQISASSRGAMNAEQVTDLLQLYAKAGSYQTLFSRLSELAPDLRKKILETHPELIFPQPWRPYVMSAAGQFDVPAELIYSIMRQESSFNPTSRSSADAFGLMQLIPEMARKAAAVAGTELNANEDLYQPEINIPLGAAFLHQTLQRWNGQFVLSVASYNANDHAIKGWLSTRASPDPVQFIEDIPYEETRNYIKLVLRNYIFYLRLNARGPSGPVALIFPERCLENIQAAKP